MKYVFQPEPRFIRCLGHVQLHRRQYGITFRCHKHGDVIFRARWHGHGDHGAWFRGLMETHRIEMNRHCDKHHETTN